MVTLLLWASVVPGQGELPRGYWYENYRDGVRAVQRGQSDLAVPLLLAAKAKGPAPARRAHFYGAIFDTFNPDYYLGEAYLVLRRFADADQSFERVRQSGLINPRDPEYGAFTRQAAEARAELTRVSVGVPNIPPTSTRPPDLPGLPVPVQPPVAQAPQQAPPAPTQSQISSPPPVTAPPQVQPVPIQTSRPPQPDPANPPAIPAIDPLAPFQEYSRHLIGGVAGFDYPQHMAVNDHASVRLRVSARKAIEELRASLQSAGRDPVVESVKLAPDMRAELSGAGFQIAAQSSRQQAISIDDDTTWMWDVKALEGGNLKLAVALTAIVRIDGVERTRDEETFYREVIVEALPTPWWTTATNVVQQYGPPSSLVWGGVPAVGASIWAWMFARRKIKARRRRV